MPGLVKDLRVPLFFFARYHAGLLEKGALGGFLHLQVMWHIGTYAGQFGFKNIVGLLVPSLKRENISLGLRLRFYKRA